MRRSKSPPVPETHRILPFAEADRRLDGALSAAIEYPYATVLLFDGDLEVWDELERAVRSLNRGTFAVIAVPGNLKVNGRIRLNDGPVLYVGGTTTAETLEVSGDSEVYLHGGTITRFVYDGGSGVLKTGKLDTPWLIDGKRKRATVGKTTKRVAVPRAKFVGAVLDDDGVLDLAKLYDRVKARKPFLGRSPK